MSARLIICRAHLADDCYNGRPVSAIYAEPLYELDDGTWEPNGTVVCDACYVQWLQGGGRPDSPIGYWQFNPLTYDPPPLKVTHMTYVTPHISRWRRFRTFIFGH